MHDVLPSKPPGHTCPGIDDARTAVRRLARMADDPGSSTALTEALAALERVRDENMALREVYVEAMAFRHIAVEAVALVRSGYDGPLAGDPVAPLLRSVADYERAKRRHDNPPKRRETSP
jgi:hypothetical protein